MKKLLMRMLVVLAALLPSQMVSAQTIAVLCYHSVSDTGTGRYNLSVAKFREQMQYLKTNGFTPLNADEYYAIMTGAAAAPPKPVLLTFDDSHDNFATTVAPILSGHGFKSVVFLVSDWIGGSGRITSAQVKSLSTTNSMENHTKSHQDLSSTSYADAFFQIDSASTAIAAITGKRPIALAYPNGRDSTVAHTAARDAGIKMGFTAAGVKSRPGDNMFTLGRYIVASSETLSSFAKKVNP
jgi:peptidoglycan/xylan/chitin deacetylase (PgdA/CDA1 family)